MNITEQAGYPVADELPRTQGLPPVSNDRTAVAMFTAHRLNDIIGSLAHADERMQAMRKSDGDVRHDHCEHFDGHIGTVLQNAGLIKDNMIAHYPPEAAEWRALAQVMNLATAVSPRTKAASFAHLLQTIMYDAAHAQRHSKAMLADRADPEWDFDADHATNHLDGAREHAFKLADHIRDNYPDEAQWLGELVQHEDLSASPCQVLELVDLHNGWAKWDAEHAKTGESVHDSLELSQPRMNSEQKQRVRYFTGDGFSEMNRRLRVGQQDKADKRSTDAMDRIVRRSVAQHDMVLLHGRTNLADVQPGDHIDEPGFMSTTTDGHAAKTYAGVGKRSAILRVRLKRGESALTTRGLSDNPTEKEVILPKGQRYQVLKVQEIKGQYNQPVRLVDVEVDHSSDTDLSILNISDQIPEIELGWESQLRDPRGRWMTSGGLMSKHVSPEGFSLDPRTGRPPRGGFMVSLPGHTHQYPDTVMKDEHELARAIDQTLMSEKETFRRPGVYLGGWVSDGKLWLDPSENLADRDEAIRTGRSRDQVAIWDVQGGQEIDTGGSGGAVTEHSAPGIPEGSARVYGLARAGADGRGPSAGEGIAGQAARAGL